MVVTVFDTTASLDAGFPFKDGVPFENGLSLDGKAPFDAGELLHKRVSIDDDTWDAKAEACREPVC